MTRNYQEIDYDIAKAFYQNPAPEDRSPAQEIFRQPLSGELKAAARLVASSRVPV